MGKRIEDLDVDDTPLGSGDDRDTEWGRFLDEINELLSDPTYNFAEETLKGIYDSVETKRYVTPGQRTAVENIAAGGRKSRGRDKPNYFRRYQR